MPTRSRPALIFAALLGVAVLASACADVERITISRHRVSNTVGGDYPALLWESNRYPDFQGRVSDACWDDAELGGPLPDSCVSAVSSILEANPYRTNRALAVLVSLVVGAGILGFALRRIAWRPAVPPEQASTTPLSEATTSSRAVDLMRVIDAEKGAQVVAEATGHDLPRPGLFGAGLGAIALPPLILLVGYGAALGWAAVTAALFLGVIGVVNLVILLPTRFQPSDVSATISRMYFVGGVAVAFLGLAVIGSLISTPLKDLHGVDWPL